MSNKSNNINVLYSFGEFRFDTKTNILWQGSELIPLTPKALELLALLVRKEGAIVSKEEIFKTVWNGAFVEEGVLTQNVYILRQALGTDEGGNQLIENVPRRGYRLSVQ
ncbi:MAG: transcriptional regulator, partial [Acidobacteria bacterium]|nr:transcriptional regulator [Acidobacteriota bacterium]